MASSRPKRRRSDSQDVPEVTQEAPAMRPMLVEVRAAEFCLDWVFPKSKCCSGCYDFADSVGLDIDNANHDSSMADKLTAWCKGQSHTSKQFKCLQLWKYSLESIAIRKNKTLAQYQKQFIQDVRSRNPIRLEVLSPTTPAVPRRLDAALETPQQNSSRPTTYHAHRHRHHLLYPSLPDSPRLQSNPPQDSMQ